MDTISHPLRGIALPLTYSILGLAFSLLFGPFFPFLFFFLSMYSTVLYSTVCSLFPLPFSH